MSEIKVKIGLNHERFDRGLDETSRGWEAWAQKVRRTPIQILPEKSARESAKVFEDIERAREEHLGVQSRAKLEQGLATGAGAVGNRSTKSAADSARAIEESLQRQEQNARELATAQERLAQTRRAYAYQEANTVGRIRILQGELVTLAKQRDREQVGTVARLRTEEQITQRITQLRSLQRQQQGTNLAVLPSLQQVEQRATGIIGLLRRKFSTADLFKDTLRSVGVTLGVGGIATAISTGFSHAADKAKSLAELTSALADNTQRWLAALGGPRRELELQVKQANALNHEIEIQRKLVADLKANPLNLFGQGAEEVRAAEEALNGLILKQEQLGTAAQIAALNDKRRTEALQRQGIHETNLAELEMRRAVEAQKFAERRRFLEEEYQQLRKQGALPSTLQENRNRIAALQQEERIFNRAQQEKRDDLVRAAKLDDQLTKAELRNASEVEKKQIRLNALREEEAVLRKRHSLLSPEVDANRNEQRRLQNEIKIDQQKAQRALVNTLAGKGNQPRPRGRSERERIADRAQENIGRAEEAVRKGQSPEFVASLTRSAARDLGVVGGKVEQSTSKVAKADAQASGSSLLQTNTLLKEIRDNLKPVKTNAGGAK